MSNIETNLAKIKSAVYGEEVRDAIHDAIHDCYEDGKAGDFDLVAREEIEDVNNTLSNRISNIIAQSGTSDTEVVDARTDTNGNSYTTLKDRLDTENTDLKNAIAKNTTDISNIGYTNYLREYVLADTVHNGINYTVNSDGSVSAVGTASGNSSLHIYIDATSLPDWIELGKRYYARVKTTDPSLYFIVMYHNGSAWRVLAQYTDDSSFVVPLNAVGFRLSIMVDSGDTVDGTISVAVADVDTLGNIGAKQPFINLDPQTAVLLSNNIYTETDSANLYLYCGSLVFRSRISVIKNMSSIAKDITLVTSPLGQSDCIAIPYGQSLIYRISTNKLEIVTNEYSGEDVVLLAYVDSSGRLAAGHLYLAWLEQSLNGTNDSVRKNTTDISNIGYTNYLREYVLADTVHKGINYTVNSDGSVSAVGTASGNSSLHIYIDATSLPDWIELGKRYYARVKTTDPSLYFIVMYHNGSAWRVLAQYTDDSSFVVPLNAVGFRLSIMVDSGDTVDGTISVAVADVDTLKNIQDNISVLQGGIPQHFEGIFPSQLQTITNNIATAGRNGFSIIHITDTHVTANSHNSEILISNILQNTRIKYLLHNGDIVGSCTDSQQSCMDELREHINGFRLHGKRMFVNIGNHDYNWVHNHVDYPERVITQDQIYATIMADMQGVRFYQSGKYHWYYIDEVSSTALIGFQTGWNYSSFGVLAEDVAPLTALLDSLTVDNIILSAHMIFSQDSGTGLYISLDNDNYNRIRAAIDASTNAAKVKCIITGHNHYDYSIVDNGVLVVSTTTDSLKGELNGTPPTEGTIDELAFDVCTFDWASDKLYMTRIGRGNSRELSLS